MVEVAASTESIFPERLRNVPETISVTTGQCHQRFGARTQLITRVYRSEGRWFGLVVADRCCGVALEHSCGAGVNCDGLCGCTDATG